MLLCPVRNCRMALARQDRRLLCPRGHSFDVARSGYINLLQPQDRRSRQPGDTAAAVAGRRRLHVSGVTAPLLDGIAKMIAASTGDVVLDAGCGDGFYLGALARQTSFTACGVDISVPAIDAAARRYPGCEWIVANADRFVPYADRSFTIVLSITGRMNAGDDESATGQQSRCGLLAESQPADQLRHQEKEHDVDADQAAEIPIGDVDGIAVGEQDQRPGGHEQRPCARLAMVKSAANQRVASGFEYRCGKQRQQRGCLVHDFVRGARHAVSRDSSFVFSLLNFVSAARLCNSCGSFSRSYNSWWPLSYQLSFHFRVRMVRIGFTHFCFE